MFKKALGAVLVLLVCEVLLRVIFLLPSVWSYVDHHQNLIVNSERLRRLFWVYRPVNGDGITYSIDDYHPRRGWALKSGLKGVECCGSERIFSNSRGLRGRVEYPINRVAGRLRVEVYGDSFSFGEEVEDEESYAFRLSGLLGAEVLNFAVHGYGLDQMLLYLREDGVKYRPDVVVLGYVPDDEHRGMYAFRDYAKPFFEWRGEGVVPELQGVPVPSPEEVRHEVQWRSRLLDLILAVPEIRWRESEPYWRRVADMSDLILAEFAGAVAGGGGIPVFVYMPTMQGISDPRGAVNMGRIARFNDFCSKIEGVKCLNLQERFNREMAAGTKFRDPKHHWGPEEHRVAADEIAAYVKKVLAEPRPEPK